MDLFKTLKNFKNIEPDKLFTERSRREILNLGHGQVFNPVKTVWRSLEFAASLSLAGVLIFVIMGGLSDWSFLSPSPLNALDPQKLRAEAEAIDIRIEFTDLLYKETAKKQDVSGTESTQPTATPTTENTILSGDDGGEEILSIDEALQLLSL